PQDLILEITESVALLDLSYESKRLHELHNAGFSLAIDDFGTGYSALSQLHAMPIDMLKIDSSFTSRLDTSDGQRIVQAIVQMADALDLKMIVEGVESGETAQYLQSIGVNYIQGHYYSAAAPAGVCDLMLQEDVQLFN
ncbi:MAG: EAL domain-containing protein, partial [Sulfuriferula sp.]